MADTFKEKYGTGGQVITATGLASLANNAAYELAPVDNTANFYLDALVFFSIKSPASATSASGWLNLWLTYTADGGTTYTGGAAGAAGSITLVQPPNLIRLGTMAMTTNGRVEKHAFPIWAALGFMPAKWGVIVENLSGGTLDTTGSNHNIWYQGDYKQFV